MSDIYDKARETAVSRPDWDEKTEVTLWQGQAARLYLKRDKGFLGVNLSLRGNAFVEQFTVALLTEEGWQLLAWANEKQYDAWAARAKAWVDQQNRRRPAAPANEPALWVTIPTTR